VREEYEQIKKRDLEIQNRMNTLKLKEEELEKKK
jgi:hypothetical protein